MKGDAIGNTLSYSLSEHFHAGLVRKSIKSSIYGNEIHYQF